MTTRVILMSDKSDTEIALERLEELKERYDVESDEYADISMTMYYLRAA
jgi:hypothetical protein